jgi:hypothetical protein
MTTYEVDVGEKTPGHACKKDQKGAKNVAANKRTA